MAWLLRWIHYRPGHTVTSYLPEATGNQQITYNLVLLPVPKNGRQELLEEMWTLPKP